MEKLRYFFNLDGNKILELFRFDPSKNGHPLDFGSSFFLTLFIGILFILFLLKEKPKLRLWFLIIFSIFFYYKASGLTLLIVLPISALINYFLGGRIAKANSDVLKKILLAVAVIINLGALAYFKYTNFFLQIAADFQHHDFQALDIIMPLGISFYTFKALSYIFDIYYEFLDEQHNFWDFLLYLSYFPNVLEGPIDRATKFIPQIKQWNPLTKEDVGRALTLIMLGLIKKYVIADYIGLNFVNRVFDEGSPIRFTGVENLLAMYAYTLQIFCDFSGYTDMAIGISLLMGFRLMENFNYPYKARSIADFWRRWHISLSSWLSDYLFRPLQMSVRSLRVFGNAIAIFVTFLLCGLWHGASWNFIIWGALHATFMSFAILIKSPKDKLYKSLGLDKSKAWSVVQVIFTFHLIAASWVFFGTRSVTTAMQVFGQIYHFFNAGVFPQFVKAYPQIVGLLVIGFGFHFLPRWVYDKTENTIGKIPLIGQALLLAAVIWVVSQVSFSDMVPFIYFQF